MKTTLPTAVWLSGLVAFGLVLSGCDQAQETEQPEGEQASVQTYSTSSAEEAPIGADRLPGTETETALTPATSLFPGTVKIDPEIQNPYAGDPEAIAAGRRHFAAFNCVGCHAPLGGGGMGPPLSDDVWIYGKEPAQVYLTILHGRPAGMPAFGAMIPERAIWELVAYIETLDEIEDPAKAKGFDPNNERFRDYDYEPRS
ncbi:c-type cytochrome [Marinobacter salicampi]|uniref:c-type cytochrome n=1 Tax=Marinobacter salicampi TaxID=435907 RepID=UPI00140A96B1|nr:c-type cytochrome [Marinobacter salicampi]